MSYKMLAQHMQDHQAHLDAFIAGIYGDGRVAPPPKPPTCEKMYRVKDTGPEQYRGLIFSTAGVLVDSWLGVLHVAQFGYTFSQKDVEVFTSHAFPDSGCAHSWCTHCGVTARFNWRLGKYEAE